MKLQSNKHSHSIISFIHTWLPKQVSYSMSFTGLICVFRGCSIQCLLNTGFTVILFCIVIKFSSQTWASLFPPPAPPASQLRYKYLVEPLSKSSFHSHKQRCSTVLPKQALRFHGNDHFQYCVITVFLK